MFDQSFATSVFLITINGSLIKPLLSYDVESVGIIKLFELNAIGFITYFDTGNQCEGIFTIDESCWPYNAKETVVQNIKLTCRAFLIKRPTSYN